MSFSSDTPESFPFEVLFYEPLMSAAKAHNQTASIYQKFLSSRAFVDNLDEERIAKVRFRMRHSVINLHGDIVPRTVVLEAPLSAFSSDLPLPIKQDHEMLEIAASTVPVKAESESIAMTAHRGEESGSRQAEESTDVALKPVKNKTTAALQPEREQTDQKSRWRVFMNTVLRKIKAARRS